MFSFPFSLVDVMSLSGLASFSCLYSFSAHFVLLAAEMPRDIAGHLSVELCETEVCNLHIQLSGTKVLLPKIHKTPPVVDFESSRSPAKFSLETNPVCNAVPCFPEIICVMNVRNQSC